MSPVTRTTTAARRRARARFRGHGVTPDAEALEAAARLEALLASLYRGERLARCEPGRIQTYRPRRRALH